jgi:hypothetical protein
MGARYYSGVLGRFMSPDPVILNAADRRDYNPNAYARNNPVALNDPTGNFAEGDTLAFGGECGNCGGGQVPGGGGDTGGGSTYPDQGVAPAEESSGGGGSSKRPSDTFVAATGSVPYSNKSSAGGLSSSNYALRSHGPTDGNATQARTAGEPWSCGARARDAYPRREDERDALAIHNYLMDHDGEYQDAWLLKNVTMHGAAEEVWFMITTAGAGAGVNLAKGGIGLALSSQGLRALWADTAGGGPNPFLWGKALVRGMENIRTFPSLNAARAAAREMAGLGDDTVKYISEVGPMRGQIVGSASRDGLRGWRIDFDKMKGLVGQDWR